MKQGRMYAIVRKTIREVQTMNCPYCGIKMEKGYVEQQHIFPLKWYSAKREGDFLWSKRKHIKLSSAAEPLVAWYCASCGKLIAEVTKG